MAKETVSLGGVTKRVADDGEDDLGGVLRADDPSADEDEVEHDVLAWTRTQVQAEVDRLKQCDQACLSIPVKNMGVVHEDGVLINRVEANTSYDFDQVKQLLLSDAVPCPCKPGYFYRNLVLFTGSIPLLMPYLYEESAANTLNEWWIVNNKLDRSHHRVEQFHNVADLREDSDDEDGQAAEKQGA